MSTVFFLVLVSMAEAEQAAKEIFSLSSHMPAIALSVVVVLSIYLAMNAFREMSAESKLKKAMYDETGIDGSYQHKVPLEGKVWT